MYTLEAKDSSLRSGFCFFFDFFHIFLSRSSFASAATRDSVSNQFVIAL